MWREVRDWIEELSCRAGFDGLPSGGRGVLFILGAAAAAAAVYFALSGRSPVVASPTIGVPQSAIPTESARTTTEPAPPTTITVHVVGEVRRPGVYELALGARAVDAIDAAGGLLGGADQAAVNLAREVTDGEQIAVPKEGASVVPAPSPPGGAAGGGGSSGKIDLNTASVEQLDTLPGVGPSTAQKIVADRTANGPFTSVDDLMRVPGIGPVKLDALRGLVTAG